MARVQRAVASLSAQQKQVLELRASGLRYRQIAATMGVGLSTVFEFATRAVARLRKAADGGADE
jgi:DNA-directed RNA polymerase specialized sigma24 family protein